MLETRVSLIEKHVARVESLSSDLQKLLGREVELAGITSAQIQAGTINPAPKGSIQKLADAENSLLAIIETLENCVVKLNGTQLAKTNPTVIADPGHGGSMV